MKSHTAIASLIIASASATALAGSGSGDILLQDANSSATFNSDSGQVSWIVDGVENLFDQSFYFRRSTDTQEYRVDDSNLGLVGYFASDTNPFIDTNNDTFAALYEDNGLEMETTFTLRGGTNGSNTSSISELISISNNTNQSMTISMFQFVDMDMGGDFSDDYAAVMDANVVQQWDDSNFVSETVATPVPTLFQVGNQADLFDALNDGAITNLDGTASAGPTDIGWAFQWDITIGAGQSFLISIEKNIVPAPGSMAFLGLAGLAATRRRR